jgi:endo-1,3(4)-beta-glucanase
LKFPKDIKNRIIPLLKNRLFAGIVILAVVISGVGLWRATHAAGNSIAVNAADGAQTSSVCTVSDSSAASGRAVKFGCSGGDTTLPPFTQRASTIATFLAPGVKPPTNQWFSNLAFKEPSDVVFAYPLAMQTMPNGFGINHPLVVSTTNTVFGSYSADLLADWGGTQTRILSYDDLSVNMEARNGTTTVATYRLTQGSPIVYISLKAGNHITWTGPQAPTFGSQSGYFTADTNNKHFLISYGNGVTGSVSGATLTLNASSDADIAVGILPSSNTDTAGFVAEMKDPITSTEVGFGASSTAVTTTFKYNTRSGNGSLMALVPAQQGGTAPSSLLGTYSTIMGTQKLYKAATYTFTNPLTLPDTNLDDSKLTAGEKSEVISDLTTDINNLDASGFSAPDSYFGGKQLARAANMMQLARNLGQTALAQSVYNKLDAQFKMWLNPDISDGRAVKYFFYDTNLKGLVGVQPSFGSDTEFNDHHFHYGYFLYAAGYMADFNPQFATDHASVLNAIVRDVANGNRQDPYFPYLRPFDQYSGHSWASGTSPFVDGNNNESSSEAVNAWYGLYMWAKSSKNTDLETQARWMFGRESNSALTYWTNFDRSQPQFANYSHSVVSMVWGGKMDYGTWFSASAYAKLGIQVLPVTPASAYLGRDPARVATNIANLNDGTAPMFPDIMTMYKSLTNPSGAVTDAKALQDNQIDDGNSRSWLMAWVYSHNH